MTSTPWDIDNNHENLISPSGTQKIIYGHLNEVAMGAPLAGRAKVQSYHHFFELNEIFGGPARWNETSEFCAIPIWTRDKNQLLGIVDIKNFKIHISHDEYRVLNIKSFENGRIIGTDSELYKPLKLDIELSKMKIQLSKDFSDKRMQWDNYYRNSTLNVTAEIKKLKRKLRNWW